MPGIDIRVPTSLRHNPKMKKLMDDIGVGACWHLISLWSAAAETRPSGVLTGCDAADIAYMANWHDDPEQLLQALIKLRWIDIQDDTYVLHEWKDHQGWVYGSQRRSEIARRNAMARWDPERRRAGRMPSACGLHATRNAGRNAKSCPSAPSPSPSPYPSPSPSPTPSQRKARGLLSRYRAEFTREYPQLDLEEEFDKCCQHWEPQDRGSGGKPDWKARLTEWMNNATKGDSHGRTGKNGRHSAGIPGNRPAGAFSHLEG